MESRPALDQWFGLAGKVVTVTGGAGVLGSAIARALAGLQARIAVVDVNGAAAAALANELGASGCEALAVQCDVLSRPSVEQARRQVVERFGRIDLLINGAGGNKREATTSPDLSFFDLPPEAIQWVLNLNLLGVILPSQVFAEVMAKQSAGCIINISSMNAYRPLTRIPAYSAGKAGVSNFTQWLAVHMAQEYSPAIRVNAIAPGFFLTEQNRFLLTTEADGGLTARGQRIIDHTPAARFGAPDDLVSTIVWLAGEGARFVTGVVVPVDGGFSAYSGV